ncbi:zinc finger CCCH domain-containing protein 12-like [Musa acuminata AAA Group]|uniref:zinc finger CCCH domain-containing protein 12-like n=1 Tax=Musa acuminata AAA Group TaxID=214697 RepID=UPI0031DEC37A
MMSDVRHNAVPNSSHASPDNIEGAMWQLTIEDVQEGADGQLNQYPDRPGQPDCLYYLRTGVCGYGSKCKYNHPAHNEQITRFSGELPQRDGQPDCQFFLKTGMCKYGITCKYHHPRDKHDTRLVQLNVFGLPIREDEKQCAHYMKTGSCKYGVACKFNHPQPANPGSAFSVTGSSVYGYSGSMAPTSGLTVIGGSSSWPFSRFPYVSSPRMQGLPAYVPFVLAPSQGNMPVQQGWSTYMGSMNDISSTDMLVPSKIANSRHQEQPGSSMPLSLPERPDQPECQYYMKTGSCKYGTSCKYHHPKLKNQADMATIGPLGLPLRPGQPLCTFYTTYGSCKYGTTCKFDHPLVNYYGYSLQPFAAYSEPSALFPGQRSSKVTRTSAEDSSSKASKLPEQLAESETGGPRMKSGTHERGNPSANSSPSDTEPHPESPQN